MSDDEIVVGEYPISPNLNNIRLDRLCIMTKGVTTDSMIPRFCWFQKIPVIPEDSGA